MNNKLNKFLRAIKNLKLQTNRYKKIKSIDELYGIYSLNYHDLSDLDLSGAGNLFLGNRVTDKSVVGGWTENVIWPTPDKMPPGFNPLQILNNSKKPNGIENLRAKNITGRGVNIAIIDMALNRTHPEYASNIKYYTENEILNDTPNKTSMHGSLVCSAAAGHECGTAPDANIYYFADGLVSDFEQQLIALKKVLALQQTLPDNEKIRILSCSFGIEGNSSGIKNTPENIAETYKVIQELQNSGIAIVQCSGREFSQFNPRFGPSRQDTVSIPTDGRTFAYFTGGYKYGNTNGDSAAAPYLAGVYACALQGNQIFCTRPNWIKEINDIMQRTATESENGGKIINPDAIVDAVSQIAREMEAQLIKQQSTQHE